MLTWLWPVTMISTGKPYRAPDPPPSPRSWIEDPTPFSVCCVDFTGALYVHEGHSERKVYICLFTCAKTRAVHLEVVLDMTLESFMLAFRKFLGCRSLHIPGCSWRAKIAIEIYLPQTSLGRLWGDVAIHSEEGTLVWWILGKTNRLN